MKVIRESISMPDNTTIMQKVISKGYIVKYINEEYDSKYGVNPRIIDILIDMCNERYSSENGTLKEINDFMEKYHVGEVIYSAAVCWAIDIETFIANGMTQSEDKLGADRTQARVSMSDQAWAEYLM